MSKSTRNKIIIALVIIALLAFAVFYFWSRNNDKQTNDGGFSSGSGGGSQSQSVFESFLSLVGLKEKDKNSNGTTTDGTGNIFPSGNNSSNNDDTDTATDIDFGFSSSASDISQGSSSSSVFEAELPILRQISDSPVAGGISFKRNDFTIIRFVDRGTGHIFETNDRSLENTMISNTTIPKVPEAVWTQNGQTVVLRYLDENNGILSFSANILTATTSQDVSKNKKSAFLPSNIEQLSANPSGDKIFYLINDAEGSVGSVSEVNGSKKKIIFQSPIKEWLISWTNDKIITLVTKPSFNVPGHLFFLNVKTGVMDKIMTGVNGLTALVSDNAKNILYSESVGSSVKLKYRNLANGDDKDLSFKTLPEKCVWSKIEAFVAYCAVSTAIPNGEYPDGWYQGLISFTDSVWKVNAKTGSSELVFDIQKETGNDIDIMNPFLSDEDEYLFFMNRKDLTLWSLAVKKQLSAKNFSEDSDSF